MKKLFTLLVLAGLLMSCHIATQEEPVKDNSKAYEAYGLLTIPTSGFTKEAVRTRLVLVDDKKLDLYMFEVKFAAAMPVTIDMLISGVDYTKTGEGISFSCNDIVPTAGGKPYEKYVIKDLNGYVTADSLCLSNKYGETPTVYEGVLVK